MRRLIPLALVSAAAALVASLVLSGSDIRGHRVVLLVDQAANMFSGVPVRAAGQDVGEIARATPTHDGRARLELRIDEDAVWPLPADTRFRLRFGGSISTSNRYVDLIRGTAGAPLRDGATIAPQRVAVPTEFDQLAGAFTAPTRRDLRALLNRGGPALSQARTGLAGSLDRAPGALEQTRRVLEDLGDTGALDTLVRSADDVAAAIDSSNPTLGDLVTNAATTFDAVAGQTAALQRTLEGTPPLLRNARHTLAAADVALTAARQLTQRLAPGVTQLRAITRPLTRVLGTVDAVAPPAKTTVATLRHASPSLGRLLARATTLAPRTTSVAREFARQLACIRPYAPEVAGMAATWGSFAANGDKADKVGRVNGQAYPFPTNTPLTPGELSDVFPSTLAQYAFPRPPGMNAGQPWFLPQCGVGRDSLDPDKDPEARAFDPLSKNLLKADGGGGR